MTKEQNIASRYLWENEKPVLQVVAGAGSGKTYTLIEAVLNCSQKFCRGEEICIVTFTKKAANELKERLFNKGIEVGFAGTMHSLAYQLLSKAGMKSVINKNSKTLLNNLMKKMYPQYSHIPVDLVGIDNILSVEEKEKLVINYNKEKEKLAVIDYDDLIIKAKEMLEKKILTHNYKVVFLDEFQDVSYFQFLFINSLRYEKLFVVGDDWQAIYKFRGGDVGLSLNFQKYVPNSQRVFLTKNFRSQKKIVQLGNKVIKLSDKFIKKKLKAGISSDKKPVLFINSKYESYHEALIKYNEFRMKKNNLHPVTILVRTNFIKRKLTPLILPGDQILTMHASKGLEFEKVLLFGISENIMPHRWGDKDEETRLLYVGVTRAKKSLEFLAWEEKNRYSRFLPFLAKNCKIQYLK
ncbi:MAG: UvrD-helicase domain-containing protein [Spirochaetia bacterium]|nr:UvrD-helicase domain-containing protein [Spirochaetia bacterium]